MPLEWKEPEEFLEFDGVKIFHTYKDDLSDIPQSYWYSTCDTDVDSEYEFDVRDLPEYDARRDVGNFDEHRKAIRAAISAGLLESEVNPQISD